MTSTTLPLRDLTDGGPDHMTKPKPCERCRFRADARSLIAALAKLDEQELRDVHRATHEALSTMILGELPPHVARRGPV